MHRFQTFLIVLAVAIPVLLVTNGIAQKFYPTFVSDGIGRKLGYTLVHRIVFVAAIGIFVLIAWIFKL